MNFYLELQIRNMIMASKNFAQCSVAAAKKDDGKIDPEEEKVLKVIQKASDQFSKKLSKLLK